MNDNNTKIGVEPFCKFNWACYGAGMMHVVYIITFAIFKMGMLVLFNIISITLYAVAGAITAKPGFSKHALLWINLYYAEVLAHALLCTVVQGLDVGFFLFPMMIMPLAAYYMYIYCDKKTFFRTITAMTAITTVTLTAVIIFVEACGTVYTLTDMHVLTRTEIITVRSINIFFAFVVALSFTVVFYLEVTRAFKELNETNKKLNYIATHDALTGLFNRHSLWKFFEELEESEDHYCIIMGDLDDFKKINDTYGHDCGDIVLKSVAGIILNNVGENDMACRWGGEKILIVMRGTREECFERVGRIKSEICSLGIVHDEQPVKVTMTFGFADSEEKGTALTEALKTAELEPIKSAARTPMRIGVESLISMVDKRLYTGKRSGKNVIIAA